MIEMSHEVKSYHWGGDDAKLALILRRPSTGERRQREDRASNSTPQKMEAVKLKLWDGHTGRLLLTRYPRAAASPSEGDRRSAGNERTGRRTQRHRRWHTLFTFHLDDGKSRAPNHRQPPFPQSQRPAVLRSGTSPTPTPAHRPRGNSQQAVNRIIVTNNPTREDFPG